jgi:hypothetical protein
MFVAAMPGRLSVPDEADVPSVGPSLARRKRNPENRTFSRQIEDHNRPDGNQHVPIPCFDRTIW